MNTSDKGFQPPGGKRGGGGGHTGGEGTPVARRDAQYSGIFLTRSYVYHPQFRFLSERELKDFFSPSQKVLAFYKIHFDNVFSWRKKSGISEHCPLWYHKVHERGQVSGNNIAPLPLPKHDKGQEEHQFEQEAMSTIYANIFVNRGLSVIHRRIYKEKMRIKEKW